MKLVNLARKNAVIKSASFRLVRSVPYVSLELSFGDGTACGCLVPTDSAIDLAHMLAPQRPELKSECVDLCDGIQGCVVKVLFDTESGSCLGSVAIALTDVLADEDDEFEKPEYIVIKKETWNQLEK